MATIPRKRRATRLAERLTPCFCCGHPISQRHHLLPAARFGEEGATVCLCANCHEAYHLFEQANLDFAAGLRRSRSIRLTEKLYSTWGGKPDPRVQYLFSLIDWAHERQSDYINYGGAVDSLAWILDSLFAEASVGNAHPQPVTIRRGDMVRLTDGKIVQVVSTSGGYIHTTEGTYGPWQVEKVAKA